MACSHTRTVGDNSSHEPTKVQGEKKVDHTGDRAGHKEDRASPAEENPERKAAEPPLAMSPTGLLKPGALDNIQEKLADKGYLKRNPKSDKLDAPTQAAIRAFQKDTNLPPTGVPDDLTVQKLGLSPSDIFRSAEKK